MMSFVIGAAVCAAVLALLCWCAVAGFRNGDQATDAEVSAVLRHAGQPGESRPVPGRGEATVPFGKISPISPNGRG
jgi:hypothetical protein